MRTLVLCDDYWHPAPVPRQGLERLGNCGFEFEFVEDAREWSAERMANYSLVVLTKSNNISSADQTPWMTPEVEEAFVLYMRQGGGLLGVHSGTAGYTQTPRLRQLLGGVFVQHPPQCPVTLQLQAGHPLCAGASTVTLQDEHYHMDMDASAEPMDMFMTTTSEHGSQPGGWTRCEGEGRVAVLTPGHNLDVWVHPSYQTLLLNTLRWCAGK